MLSIDVGFGNVKVYDGEEVTAFPSVYMEASDDYIPTTDPDDQLLELDGVKYHVGMTALNRGGEAPFDRTDMLRHKIFMLTAICAMTDAENFSDSVAVGLPISDYKAMKDTLAKLKGKYEVSYNGKKCSVDIKKISVYAQSEAVYKLIAKDDKDIKRKVVGIVDIGQKTVDFAYFKRGTYVPENSGSLEKGVINAYRDIVKALENVGYNDIESYEAKLYIDKVPEDADKAFEKMAKTIKNNLRINHWNLELMDSLYIVGGGTSFIAPHFKDTAYKPLDEMTAVFANAYGYYAGEKE